MRTLRLFLSTCIALLVTMVLASSALANSHAGIYREIAGSTGIAIAPMEHGQLLALNEHRAEIIALAETYKGKDAIADKLLAFTNLEHGYALNGNWTDDMTNDASPMHVVIHGDLAGARALLIRLRDFAPNDPAVTTLADNVEKTMITVHNTSLVLCVNSGEEFNTLQPVVPDLTKVQNVSSLPSPDHTVAIVAALMVPWLGFWLFMAFRRTRQEPLTFTHQHRLV